MRSASSVLTSTAAVKSRRESGAIRRVRLRCLRRRSAMIRLPMLNVDSWFAGVRDGDEWAAQSAAPNALCWCRARKMCSAQRSRGITASAIESICLNQDAVGIEALERHSEALHIGRCEGRAVRHERDVSNIRLVAMLSIAIEPRRSPSCQIQVERRRGQRPQAVRNARSKRSGER